MADSDLDREKDDEGGETAASSREGDVEPTRVDNKVRGRGRGRGAGRGPLSELDDPAERGPAAYLAEFVGTFGLVFFVALVVVLYAPGPIAPAQPGLPETQPFQDWSVIGLTHAFILFALIQIFGIVSGAHFNPAVTIALAAIRQIRPVDAAIYIVVQLLGAILGGFVVKLLVDNENAGAGSTFGAPDIGNAAAGSTTVALAAEVIGTFFLVLAIVGVAVNPRGIKDWAGFAIGATLAAAVMILGPISGAGLNPARSFGPSVVADFGADNVGEWILIWVVGPILGALLAAFLYFQTVILPGKKGTDGMDPVG